MLTRMGTAMSRMAAGMLLVGMLSFPLWCLLQAGVFGDQLEAFHAR